MLATGRPSNAAVPGTELRRRGAPATAPAPSALASTSLRRIHHQTPFLACDVGVVEESYRQVQRHLPAFTIHYAVKCNPAPQVLRALAAQGCQFEVASIGELSLVEAIGAPGSAVLFSNPVKAPAAVAAAHRRGVTRFAVDSAAEVHKVATQAPGASVYVRLAVDDSSSLFPLSRKFGVGLEESERLLLLARSLGLTPYGVTFHVGSQCTDAKAWQKAITRCGALLGRLAERGVRLQMLDIGGGFPARYTQEVPSISTIADGITTAVSELPYTPALLVAEPGRSLVATSGVMVTSIIGVAERDDGPWVYLDAGGYNGMMEAVQTGGRWAFPLRTSRPDGGTAAQLPFTVTGPSCDASDTMFYDAWLPADLEVGDHLYIGVAGAYSLSYASSFNGFGPPPLVVVGGAEPGRV